MEERTQSVEVEAKFKADKCAYEALLHYLRNSEGFTTEDLGQFQRTHLYYRVSPDMERQKAQPRLRLILMHEGGGRYDYKALRDDNPASRSSTDVSVGWPKGEHVTLHAAIETLCKKVGAADRTALKHFGRFPEFSVAFQGTHHKTRALSENIELEISWDNLVLLNTGDPLSELEVELKRGDRELFDGLIGKIRASQSLSPVLFSKHQQALSLVHKNADRRAGDNG